MAEEKKETKNSKNLENNSKSVFSSENSKNNSNKENKTENKTQKKENASTEKNKSVDASGIKKNETKENDEFLKTQKEALQTKKERIQQKNEDLIKKILKQDKNKKERRKKGFILLLVLLLLFVIGIGAGVWIYIDYKLSTEGGNLRVSVSIENKDEIISVTPGDTFDLVVKASNSVNFGGDYGDGWSDIYLRYKVSLIVDGVEIKDAVKYDESQNYQDNFIKYVKEVEDTYVNDAGMVIVKQSDGYNYYKGKIANNNVITLIDRIYFDGDVLTEIVGGKSAELVVEVEAIEAVISTIVDRLTWENAPHAWVSYMREQFYEDQNTEQTNNSKINTTKDLIKLKLK